jgi:predicted RNA-binding protein with PUA-like domain
MNHWLLKSEPDSFSIDDLAARPKQTTAWDGVRNYQARNMLRESMKKGDTGIAGIVRVSKEGYPDKTAFDPKDDHYDAQSDPSDPRWFVVDVKLVRKLKRLITLDELRRHANDELSEMRLLQRGNRLSVTPVSKAEWEFILTLE